ncbi:MAG TPA: HlyD family efflux transporter periplasmic adaptor subunit [Thermoanaerobaculia bacterium]
MNFVRAIRRHVFVVFVVPLTMVCCRGADGTLELSGRIESDDAVLASRAGGRVRALTVVEGSAVRRGQTVAVLDDDQVQAQSDEASAAVARYDAYVARAERQVAVLRAALRQAELMVPQAGADAQGNLSRAVADVAAAEARVAHARATEAQAAADARRLTALHRDGVVAASQAETARAIATAAAADVRAAEQAVSSGRGALEAVRANLTNPAIRTAAADEARQALAAAEAELHAARAEADAARAALRRAEARRKELVVVAPFDGVIATRAAEPGDTVEAGTPLVTLMNPAQMYMRAFVPQSDVARIKVGQRAHVILDHKRGRTLEARVTQVDPRSAFTPENVYFREDRVKQVVGVKLLLLRNDGSAKPGMPADAEIVLAQAGPR